MQRNLRNPCPSLCYDQKLRKSRVTPASKQLLSRSPPFIPYANCDHNRTMACVPASANLFSSANFE